MSIGHGGNCSVLMPGLRLVLVSADGSGASCGPATPG